MNLIGIRNNKNKIKEYLKGLLNVCHVSENKSSLSWKISDGTFSLKINPKTDINKYAILIIEKLIIWTFLVVLFSTTFKLPIKVGKVLWYEYPYTYIIIYEAIFNNLLIKLSGDKSGKNKLWTVNFLKSSVQLRTIEITIKLNKIIRKQKIEIIDKKCIYEIFVIYKQIIDL